MNGHQIVDEGLYISDPVCQICRRTKDFDNVECIPMTKVFITKYALSGGITEFDADIRYPDYAPYGIFNSGQWGQLLRLGSDAFLTRDEAVADAEKRRVKKIASLQKQIAKLEKVTFA